jgi:hypothetical protein
MFHQGEAPTPYFAQNSHIIDPYSYPREPQQYHPGMDHRQWAVPRSQWKEQPDVNVSSRYQPSYAPEMVPSSSKK